MKEELLGFGSSSALVRQKTRAGSKIFPSQGKRSRERKNRKHNNSTKQGNRNLRKRNTLVWEKKESCGETPGELLSLALAQSIVNNDSIFQKGKFGLKL